MQSQTYQLTVGVAPRLRPIAMPVTKPLVFVVDDDVSVRESLEGLIGVSGWEPRVFSCAETFLDGPPASGPCCLVLDIGLPDLNGLDLQTLVAGSRSHMPIIFITGYGDVPTSVQAMKAGAAEFLTKPFNDEILLRAIAVALEKSRSMVDEQIALRTLRERHDLLSRREREVMALIVAGLLNKQVGGELGISEITVKAHRGRVMEKMKARSFAELVKMSASLNAVPHSRP